MSLGRASRGEFDPSDPLYSFLDVVHRVVHQPVGFFAAIPGRANLRNPLLFALICIGISELAVLGTGFFIVGAAVQSFQIPGGGSSIVLVILKPIFGVIGLLIGAGITHLLVILIVGAGNSGFEATVRVYSYASVAYLVNWVPVIGVLLGFLYGLYLASLGAREVHGTTTGKAALVVLLPAGVLFLP